MTIRGGGNPNSAMAAMPLGEWTAASEPCPQKRMTASWSRPHVGSTEYKRGSRDCSRPMAGSPRIIARPTTRSRAACRRARVRQGQAFGGAEEAPSLTATARDGGGNVRSGWKNARGAGRTKEWSNNARQKWRDAPLTKKAPYMRESRTYGSVRGARDETRVPTATEARVQIVM